MPPPGQILERQPDGSVVLRNPRYDGEIADLIQQGQGNRIRNLPEDEFRALQREQYVEREVGSGTQAFVEGGVNALTAGGLSLLTSMVDPAAAVIQTERANRLPGASMAGAALATAVTAGVSLGAGGLASAARLTAAGGPAAIGQSVTRALAGSMGRGWATTAGFAVDATLSGALFSLENSIIQNEPITAERVLMDAGFSGVLGIGLGGSFAGGRYALTGARAVLGRQMGQRMANAGLQEGASQLGWLGRLHETVSRHTGMGSAEAFQLAVPRTRRLAAQGRAEADGIIQRLTGVLDENLRSHVNLVPTGTARSARFNSLLEGVDHRPLQTALIGDITGATGSRAAGAARQGGILNGIAEGAAVFRHTSQEAITFVNRAAAVARRGHELVASASSIGDTVNALSSVRNSLAGLRAPANSSGQALSEINDVQRWLQTQGTLLDNLMSSDIFSGTRAAGSIATLLQAESRRGLHSTQLLAELGVEVAGEVGESALVRQVDGRRIASMFEEAGNSRSHRLFQNVTDYLESEDAFRRAAVEVFEIDPETIRSIDQGTRLIRSEITDGLDTFEAFALRERALKLERQEAGFAIVTGLSAGAVASGLGAGELGVGGAAVGATAVVGAIIRPAAFYSMLGNMERAWGRTTTRRAASITGMRRTMSGVGNNIRNAAGAGTRKLPVMVARLQDKATRREEYQRVTSDIRELAANPDIFETRFLTGAGEMGDHFPQLLTTMAGSAMRAIQYLNASLPPASVPTPFSHLPGTELEPSFAEMDDFLRRFHAIEDPFILFDGVANFTLTRSQIEAVQVVYPELFAGIQQDTMRMLESLDNLPPYQARMQVSQLLQLPADPSLEPAFIERMQRTAFQTQQQQRSQISIRTGSSINVAGDTYSASQQISQRL